MKLHLENIPKSVKIGKDGEGPYFEYIDERQLPATLRIERTRDWRQVVDAIKTLAVRGAPAIGLAGASALTLWMAYADSLADIDQVAEAIAVARPTAVNLQWAVNRALATLNESAFLPPESPSVPDPEKSDSNRNRILADGLFDLVEEMQEEDEARNRAIGKHGAALLAPGSRILTHCNAGSLAVYYYGTALGIVYTAAEQGKIERVYADETRPVGQGARLTTWELARAGVPTTLICDNMAASLMANGEVDAVIVGADRIARNGDVANKIGTYSVAVLAHEHGIPFYVAAPTSTIDSTLDDGSGIVIEVRDASEVLSQPIEGVDVWNPAFDVTPARYITRIITEEGAFEPERLP